MEFFETIFLIAGAIACGCFIGMSVGYYSCYRELRARAEASPEFRNILIAGKQYWFIPDKDYHGPRPVRKSAGNPLKGWLT